MPRELSKCREWEKDRRERLKKGFASLCKILPCYEPSLNLSKIDVLQKAEEYIEELQTQVQELLDGKGTKPEYRVVKKLHDRVKKLIIRNEQLCNLLLDAGIRLPSDFGNVKKFRGKRIWSNRISTDYAKKLQKKEKESELKRIKKKVQNKSRKIKNGTCLRKKLLKKSEVNGKHTTSTNYLQTSNFITLVTTQSCFIITNAPSTNVNQNCLAKTTTVLTNSNLFSMPLVASTVKPSLVITKSNGTINTVSSGTLLVANGSLVPVIQQPTIVPAPTILTNQTPIVVKPAPAKNATVFVVPSSDVKNISANKQQSLATSCTKTSVSSKTTNGTKTLPILKPKRRDLSKIAHINKVPIPALTSKYADDLIPEVNIPIISNSKTTRNNLNKGLKKELNTNINNTNKISVEKATPDEEMNKNNAAKHSDVLSDKSTSCKIVSSRDDADVEPIVKKPKLSSNVNNETNDDNKKINIISAYSIDSLCNDVSEVVNEATDAHSLNKSAIVEKSENEIQSVPDIVTEKSEERTILSDKRTEISKINLPSPTELDMQQNKIPETTKPTIPAARSNCTTSKEKHSLDCKAKPKDEQKNTVPEITNSLMHSDLSNDIFASLSHVTAGGQNPESTSPTAAFLLAFPLVSSLNSLKVTEVIEDETTESQHGTPTLLQIGTMDLTKTTQSQPDNLTPNLLNLDSFSFFSREFYPPFDPIVTSSSNVYPVSIPTSMKIQENKKDFIDFNIDLSEKKVTCSDTHAKTDLKYTLKSVSSNDTFTYECDNKTFLNPVKIATCQSASSVPVCQNAHAISNQSSTIITACRSNNNTTPISQRPTIASASLSSTVKSAHQNTVTVSSCQVSSVTSSCISAPAIMTHQVPTIRPVCQSTSVVSVCQSNSIVPKCQNNKGQTGQNNTTLGTCLSSTEVPTCLSNAIVPSCLSNTIVPTCLSNTGVPTCLSNTIVSTCLSKTVVSTCLSNTIIPTCSSNTIVPIGLHNNVVPTGVSNVPSCLNNTTMSTGLRNTTVSTSLSNTTVPTCLNNAIVPTCLHSTVVPTDLRNTIVPTCLSNAIVPTCLSNAVVPTCLSNTIVSTGLSNTIAPTCINNTMVPTCLTNNTVLCRNIAVPTCRNAALASTCSNNTIASACRDYTIAQACHNEISASFPTTNTNTYITFTSADYNMSYNHSFYTGAQTVTTSSTATVTSAKHQLEKSKISEKKACNYYPTSTAYSVPQYNTFNPFTDIPKSITTYPNSTKNYNDGLYTNNGTYSYNYHPDNFSSTYPPTKTNVKPDKFYYGLNYDNYDYKHNNFDKYEMRNQQFGNYYSQNQIQNKDKTEASNKTNVNSSANAKIPVNWMTTPDVRQQTQNDFIVPTLGKEMDFTPNPIYSSNSFSAPQTTYFNTNASLYTSGDLHNAAPFPTIPPNSFQRSEIEENQFSWSPSKLPQLLDTTHNFVSGTLPTLVGDLALGNTQAFVEQKIDNRNSKDFRMKETIRRSKPPNNYDNQSNFLSVSQLVDHNKNDAVPSRVANRRSSGNRSSTKSSVTTKNSKRASKTDKDINNYNNSNNNGNKVVEKQMKSHNNNNQSNQEYQNQNNNDNYTNMIPANKNRNVKMPSSSYSAEALIGHQSQNEANRHRNTQNYSMVNKSLPVPFLTDNIIPYFPMDIPQDNNLTQQNQNYQSSTFGHNFSSGIQGSVYPNGSYVPNAVPITTSYLSSTNFIPDLGTNTDYAPILPENTFTHVLNRTSDKYAKHKPLHNEKANDKRNMVQSNTTYPANTLNPTKKTKKKPPTEPTLSNFDFSFLSMPAAINSPILPDDFHTHSNFLPPPTPTQLYPCKNPLYGKQDLAANGLIPLAGASRGGVPHPEVSPSLNNVGTTLTNFNLSTIFPEINKVSGPIPDMYPDNLKSKDYNQRDFLGSTSQVPFKSNLSYINSPTSTN